MSFRLHIFFTLLEILVQFLVKRLLHITIQTNKIVLDEVRRLTAPQLLEFLLYLCQSLLLFLQQALLHRQVSLQQRWHLRTIVDLKQVWDPHLPILVNNQF